MPDTTASEMTSSAAAAQNAAGPASDPAIDPASDIGRLELVEYPHPALSRRSRPIATIDDGLRDAVDQMFEIMYAAGGVGLAANQVALPYRLFVMNPEGRKGAGEEIVVINPVLSRPRGSAVQEEGCLSLPGLRMDVRRPERVVLEAFTLDGELVRADLDGFPARIVQHEFDHLEGRLFTDRLTETAAREARRHLDEMVLVYAGRLERGEAPPEAGVVARLDALERARCTA
jgi:peptide deformylase